MLKATSCQTKKQGTSNPNAPYYRSISEGLNVGGRCSRCNTGVVANLGFIPPDVTTFFDIGKIDGNIDCSCSGCNGKLDEDSIDGLYFRNCKYKIEGRWTKEQRKKLTGNKQFKQIESSHNSRREEDRDWTEYSGETFNWKYMRIYVYRL